MKKGKTGEWKNGSTRFFHPPVTPIYSHLLPFTPIELIEPIQPVIFSFRDQSDCKPFCTQRIEMYSRNWCDWYSRRITWTFSSSSFLILVKTGPA